MDIRKFSITGIKEPYYIMLSGTNRRASCRGCIIDLMRCGKEMRKNGIFG